jgi:hypothetical protein
LDRIAGLQDLQVEGLGLNWGLTMDRITGWQDLQDRVFWRCCGLTMDRIAGLQDLQDRMVFLGLSRGLNMDRIT